GPAGRRKIQNRRRTRQNRPLRPPRQTKQRRRPSAPQKLPPHPCLRQLRKLPRHRRGQPPRRPHYHQGTHPLSRPHRKIQGHHALHQRHPWRNHRQQRPGQPSRGQDLSPLFSRARQVFHHRRGGPDGHPRPEFASQNARRTAARIVPHHDHAQPGGI